MKKIIPLMFAVITQFTIAFAISNTDEADKVLGIYWSPKKDAKIEIYKKANRYFGRSVWTAANKKDIKNPDASLKTRALAGVDLFTNFMYKDGIYLDGKIYDPESGKTYDCKMSLNGNILKVRGYIGISLLGRTELFERIN